MIAASSLRWAYHPLPGDQPASPVNVVPPVPPKCSRRCIRRGEALYGAGEAFGVLYVVRIGILKSFMVSDDGLMHVTGFSMAGDVIGLDGIATGQHPGEVVALDDAEVFVLPWARCEQWSLHSEHGHRLMMRVLAHEIVRSKELMIMLGAMHADQRIAIFLLDLSRRYSHLGYSPSQFVLRMTRQDIGSYLGLKLETVSRLLSRLHRDGTIQVRGKSIALLDFPALWRLSGLSSDSRRPTVTPIVDRDGELVVAPEAGNGGARR